MENKTCGNLKIKASMKYKIILILKFSFILFLIKILRISLPSLRQRNRISLPSFKHRNSASLLTINALISKLKTNQGLRKPKYILFFDFLSNKYCNDYNSYLIFQNYLERNKKNAYYVINKESELYNSLLLKNKTNNLILYNQMDPNSWNNLYPYLLDSKIMVHSYILHEFIKIVKKINYLKYLKINHGIRYFKNRNFNELECLKKGKRNTIISSPYEYNKR